MIQVGLQVELLEASFEARVVGLRRDLDWRPGRRWLMRRLRHHLLPPTHLHHNSLHEHVDLSLRSFSLDSIFLYRHRHIMQKKVRIAPLSQRLLQQSKFRLNRLSMLHRLHKVAVDRKLEAASLG